MLGRGEREEKQEERQWGEGKVGILGVKTTWRGEIRTDGAKAVIQVGPWKKIGTSATTQIQSPTFPAAHPHPPPQDKSPQKQGVPQAALKARSGMGLKNPQWIGRTNQISG